MPRWVPARDLLWLLLTESERPQVRLMLMVVVSGASNSLLLAIVNKASHMTAGETTTAATSSFFIFLVGLIIFTYSKYFSLSQANIMMEEVLRKMRLKLVRMLKHSEVRYVETSGHSFIYTQLSQDTQTVSAASKTIFAAIESAVMLIATLAYLFVLDVQGALMVIVAIALSAALFLKYRPSLLESYSKATQSENEFFTTVATSLDAFKELKLNSRKREALFRRQGVLARTVESETVTADNKGTLMLIASQLWFYILLGMIVFVLPKLGNTSIDNVVKLTTAILFIIGPLEIFVGSLPQYMKINRAINRLSILDQALKDAIDDMPTESIVEPPTNLFGKITYSNVVYSYYETEQKGQHSEPVPGSTNDLANSPEQPTPKQRRLYQSPSSSEANDGFSLGPLDLEIVAGEILFIVGPNGAGKSTLLKLMTGLYKPQSGVITSFGEPVTQQSYPQFRELFTTIFADYFLFQELYGYDTIDPESLNHWLDIMGLHGKTEFKDGRWSTIDLSTGQRKRLAYINCLIENKQIYIFDELAADQDPDFRKYFYRTLLPDLRDDGKSIVVVTHDDRYFDSADRVIRLESNGKISNVS